MDQQQPTSSPSVEDRKVGSFWGDIIKFTIVALIVVIPIRAYVAEPFIVSGDSMDPTFATGQYLIVNQLSYHVSDPQRGQVIIFKYPKDTTKYFIKRVIGLPGDTVILNGTSVTIKNKENPQGFTLSEPYIAPQYEKNDYITYDPLPAGQYFVMGDNRLQSSDSRVWGDVPRDLIIGTPILRLFPFDKIATLPGDYKEAQ